MIKFIRDTLEKEGGSFMAGEVAELSPASEFRWLKRGAAELVEPEPEQEIAPEPKPAKKKSAAKHKGK